MATLREQFWELYGDSSALYIENFATRRLAQLFKATTSYLLSSVKVNAFRTGTLADVYVYIYATTGTVPSGSPLESAAVDMSALGTVFTTLVEFQLAGTLQITNGTTYAIAFGHAASGRFTWRQDASSPSYTDGNAAYSNNSGSSWTTLSGQDALFQTYGEDLPVAGNQGAGHASLLVAQGVI